MNPMPYRIKTPGEIWVERHIKELIEEFGKVAKSASKPRRTERQI